MGSEMCIRDRTWVVVIDEQGKPRSWPTLEELASKPEVSDYLDKRLPVVALSSTLNDALDSMLSASQGGVLVTDGRGAVVGALTIAAIMEVIRGNLAVARAEEQESYASHAEESDS